jgi:hypothetical protein
MLAGLCGTGMFPVGTGPGETSRPPQMRLLMARPILASRPSCCQYVE